MSRDWTSARIEANDTELTGKIIHAAIEVHRNLGPGLLESIYERALSIELLAHGIAHIRQMPIEVRYKNHVLGEGYRADILVEQKILLELKVVDTISNLHIAQIMTYLKFLKIKQGLILNFNVRLLKDGIKRISL